MSDVPETAEVTIVRGGSAGAVLAARLSQDSARPAALTIPAGTRSRCSTRTRSRTSTTGATPLWLSACWRSRRSRLDGGGPGLTRVRGAGFLFHRGAPGREAGSYRRSAGV